MQLAHPGFWSHAKALWALCWRMFVFGPIIAIFGTVLFWAVLGLTFFPPAFAVASMIRAEYGWALLSIAVWLTWLKFGGRLRRFVSEGFEHGSL